MANRAKMSVENRAKQFAPFAAVTGLDRALEQKLRELDETARREFSEETAAQLDASLRSLRKGVSVTVRYYHERKYLTVSGVVERIEEAEHRLKLGAVWIPFDDIAALTPEADA